MIFLVGLYSKKGTTIEINKDNIPIYERLIKIYENNDLYMLDSDVYINGSSKQININLIKIITGLWVITEEILKTQEHGVLYLLIMWWVSLYLNGLVLIKMLKVLIK